MNELQYFSCERGQQNKRGWAVKWEYCIRCRRAPCYAVENFPLEKEKLTMQEKENLRRARGRELLSSPNVSSFSHNFFCSGLLTHLFGAPWGWPQSEWAERYWRVPASKIQAATLCSGCTSWYPKSRLTFIFQRLKTLSSLICIYPSIHPSIHSWMGGMYYTFIATLPAQRWGNPVHEKITWSIRGHTH